MQARLTRATLAAIVPFLLVVVWTSMVFGPVPSGPVSVAPTTSLMERGAAVPSGSLSVSLTLTPTTTDQGGTVNVNVAVSGGTPPYSYNWANLPNCGGQNLASWSCTATKVGSATVWVYVNDSAGPANFGDASANLVVNAAPSLQLSVSPTSVSQNSQATFTLQISGGTPPYNNMQLSGMPQGCTYWSSGSTYTCNPSQTGTYTIKASATDSVGVSASSNSVTLTVSSSSGGNGGSGNNSSGFSLGSVLPPGFVTLVIILVVLFYVLLALIAVGTLANAIVLARRLKPGLLAGTSTAGGKGSDANSVHCTECGAGNGPSFKFCQACGKPLAPTS